MELNVDMYNIPSAVEDELNQRMVLLFTGQPRLAKNILRNVLRQWASRKQTIVDTVEKLVREAEESVQAIGSGDINRLGNLVSSYWRSKKIMAGGHKSGVEPKLVESIFDALYGEGVISGGSLCGAGGGGCLFLLLCNSKSTSDAKLCVRNKATSMGIDFESITWYECNISRQGISIDTKVVDE
jgi:fucokinase